MHRVWTWFASIWLVLVVLKPSAIPGDASTQTARDFTSTAEAFVGCLAKGDPRSAVAPFDATMKKALPEEKLRDTWRALLQQAGEFKKQLGTRILQIGGFDVVFVTCEFDRAVIDVKIAFNAAGQIAGLFFVPGTRPSPDTAAPSGPPRTVRETDFKVGEGGWVLDATLSLPATHSATLCPAVVLVHGSGPNDRDETVGANKPFRDLAWGLASKGVAVLRYEKRTKAHPTKCAVLGKFTVKEETLDDALSAVRQLRATPGIDPRRVFVLGHSLGATVAPRIGEADSSIAGLILLAGSTRSLEDLMVEQVRYLLSLDGDLSSADNAKLAALEAEVKKVKQAADPASEAPILGAPLSYWLDLRRYDAPATAKKLKQPLLLLQGGRDYQVTEVDFDGWKKGLGSRPDTTFTLYPKLNHLFAAGEGKSTPAEYEQPTRVAEPVIQDIADWISTR